MPGRREGLVRFEGLQEKQHLELLNSTEFFEELFTKWGDREVYLRSAVIARLNVQFLQQSFSQADVPRKRSWHGASFVC